MPGSTPPIPHFPLDGTRRHKLLTAADAACLPAQGSTDGQGDDALVVLKFFGGGWTWLVLEGWPEGADWYFFGLVQGLRCELGEFCLSQLATSVNNLGLPFERDKYFTPAPLRTFR